MVKIDFKTILLFIISFGFGYIIGGSKVDPPMVTYENPKLDSLRITCDSLKFNAEQLQRREDSIRITYDSLIYELKNQKHEKINRIKRLSVDNSIIFLREELSRKDGVE